MAIYPSNRDEIIELAQLEVLGGLESSDCVRLDLLFRDASMPLQREIIDLQASLASRTDLLPNIDAERSLRLRVLASVAQAVEASDAELAPIAAIGRPGAAVVGSFNAAAMATLDRAAPSRIADDLKWRRSSIRWRLACIAAIGGLVAALVLSVAMSRQSARISELALQNATSAQLTGLIGSGLAEFLDQRCVVKGLVGSTARDNGSVTVMLAPTLDAALIVWVDFTVGQNLLLQSFDRQSGITRDAGQFVVINPLGGTRISLDSGVAKLSSDWRIVDARGVVVFSTQP